MMCKRQRLTYMNMFMKMLFEIMWVCSLCVDVKIRRCEDVRVLVARDRQGMLHRRCELYIYYLINKHGDMLIDSQTQTHAENRRETCLHIYHTDTHTNPHTHTQIYTQKLLHTEVLHTKTFTHRSFTHRNFYTQKPVRLNTQMISHTEVFTRRRFYTQFFYTHRFLRTETFTHRHFYTQTLLRTDAFEHSNFYIQKHSHTETFTHRTLCRQKLLYTDVFTHRNFYIEKFLHTHCGICRFDRSVEK